MAKRILVVEDDWDIRLALRDRLQSMGFDVVTEDNGQSALSRITLEAPRSLIHGVLLDLHLPIVDGITVLRELRDRHPQIPVIVMSATNDPAQFIDARKFGATSYLRKPFDRETDWDLLYWIFHKD